MIVNKKLLTILIILFSFRVSGQTIKLPSYFLETGGFASIGRQSPFWFVCNQFGRQSVQPASGFISAKLQAFEDSSRKFDYLYGLELYDRFDGKNTFWIHQAYVKARFHFVYFRIGKCEETYGNQDKSLSSGSALWSQNTRPMPKIVLGTNEYVNIPFTNGYVQINSMLSHGWFGKDGYVKNVYLHHKYLYIKLGGKLPVNISWGLQHYAMWGGTDPVLGTLPKDWDAYRRVFFNKQGNFENPDTPENEARNKLGNHLGSRNYGIDIRLKKALLQLYYQTIFEDRSGYKKKFMPDGLWGISIQNRIKGKIIDKILYEHFRSTYQSGGIQYEQDGSPFVDCYFHHDLYKTGWTYHKLTIGNPLISSPVIINEDTTSIVNNRVIAHHMGLSGIIHKTINYKFIITFSRNYGTFYNSFPKPLNSTSIMLQIGNEYKGLNGTEIMVQFGIDIGKMYGNNAGFGIMLRKHGIF